MNKRKIAYRLISVLLGLIVLYSFGFGAIAQDETPAEETAVTEAVVAEEVVEENCTHGRNRTNQPQSNLVAHGWFPCLLYASWFRDVRRGPLIRHTGVVNSLAENFMDACVTGVVFFIVGYGIAYGAYDAEAGIGSPLLGQV